MNEQDLRVIKTRERIENAMLALLRTRPLEKITVTELARVAMVNKGTFYLHYLDIHDLYRQIFLKCLEKPFVHADFFPNFFDAPEQFLVQMGAALAAGMPDVQTIKQPGTQDFMFMEDVRNILGKKVYETGRIEKTVENDIKLDALFSAMLGIMPKYASAGYFHEAHKLIASMIRSQFPMNTSETE